MEKKCARIDQYLLVRTLGAGYNSKVKLGVDITNNKQYAVKILKDVYNRFIKNEIDVLNALKSEKKDDPNAMIEEKPVSHYAKQHFEEYGKVMHPNIINLIKFLPNVDYFKKNGGTKKVTAIVLEIAGGGELFEFLFRTGKFSEDLSRYYFHSLIDSLDYIHSKGYSHRDLKPENLLLTTDFILKLADFGFSTLTCGKDGKGLLDSFLGTRGYMAPEIISRTPYHGPAVDMFAAGIILFIMYAGIPPFTEAATTDPYFKLLATNKHDYFWFVHSKSRPQGFYSADFKDLINKMLAVEPANRASMSQVKEHPWFKGNVPAQPAVQEEMQKRAEIVAAESRKEKEAKLAAAAKKKMEIESKKTAPMNMMNYPDAKAARVNITGDTINEIEAQFNLKLQRQAAEYDAPTEITNNDILCPDPLDDALLAVLFVLKEHKATDVNVSDRAYKVKAKLTPEGKEPLSIQVRLFQNDDKSSYVRFERQEGPVYDFSETVKSLETKLNEVTAPPAQ